MPLPSVAAHIVSIGAVREAAERIRGVARKTPLLSFHLQGPDGQAEFPVWLKCENLQVAGAFKLRGAYNFISSLDEAQRTAGVITYSSGNHAQAVAYSAARLGLRCTVVMPTDAPRIKLDATRRLGSRVEQVGTTTVERKARAEELQRESGGTMVPPFDHPRIIAGQGTTGLEILDQLRLSAAAPSAAPAAPSAAPLVVVPVGGGGLISGIAATVRALVPDARIVGVEPEGAAKMSRSLSKGHPVTIDEPRTIADGLKPVRPGDLTFAHCQALVDEVVTVSDGEMIDGVLACYDRKLVVEPSGAAAVAALMSGRIVPPDSQRGATVAVLSGGNIDPSLLAGWLLERVGLLS